MLKPTLLNVTVPTAIPKMTSTTSIVMTMALLNSNMSTTSTSIPITTTAFSPTLNLNYLQSNCYLKIIECPFPLNPLVPVDPTVATTSTRVVPANVTQPVERTTVTADGNVTDRPTTTTGFVSSVGSGAGLHKYTDGTNFEPAANANWTVSTEPMGKMSTTEPMGKMSSTEPMDKMSTEPTDKMSTESTIGDLLITGQIVYDTSSEETETDTTDDLTDGSTRNAEPDPTSGVSTESAVTGSTTESTEPTSSSSTYPTSSSRFTPESVPDSFTEPIAPIFDPKSIPMVDGESMIPVLDVDDSTITDTTTAQSMSLADKKIATDRPYAGDSAPSERRRVKRMPDQEYFISGNHCYQPVCSPPPTQKSYPGFSEKSGKY